MKHPADYAIGGGLTILEGVPDVTEIKLGNRFGICCIENGVEELVLLV